MMLDARNLRGPEIKSMNNINNNIISKQRKAKEKTVGPGGAQTHTFCSLGKHPNHLDHQHY